MAKGQIKRVIFYLLPIIVLIILASIFLVNLFPKATDQSRGAILSIADKIAGKETVKAGEIVVEPAHLEAIDHLKTIIRTMVSSPDNECYSSYQFGSDYGDNLFGNNGFPSLGEKGTKILFEAVSKGMRITTFGGVEGLQEHSSEVITGASPCVISGGSVPKIFYEIFVKDNRETRNDPAKFYFNPVNKIMIKYDLSGNNENRLAYGPFIEEDLFLDFEDGGLIFKVGRNICFFPTVDDAVDPIGVCDGDSAIGLDDDCLGSTQQIISLSEGRLKKCEILKPPRLGS